MRTVLMCLALIFMSSLQPYRADAQQSTAPYAASLPDRRGQCIQILEFEKLRIDPSNGLVTFNPQDAQLFTDYTAVVSWLQGFLAGRQVNNPYSAPQIEIWLLSYCRTNPTRSLFDAALQLSTSLSQH
jgi:hypothetical protein